MITPGQFFRLFTIQRTLIRHGVDEIIFATPLLRSFRFLLYLLPWNWWRHKYAPTAVRLRHVLEELGPIFVKFGQILSTRRDLLPDDIAEELAKLQDRVPPFPGREARRLVEKAHGRSLEEMFAEFDEQPLASASIAQVHAARLQDGREVVVKVVRPGILTVIRRDIGLMYILARALEKYWGQGRRLKPTGVVAEFEKTLVDELDLLREAANASQLRRNFANAEAIYVPEVHWELTLREVLVMERVSGIRVDDVASLKAAGVNLQWLAESGVEIFFTQVFRDHFFHADMHPGNLFVQPLAGGRARFVPVDFGIMGSLSDFDQRYLAENFLAFMNRDYRRVAQLHVESGWVPRDTRVDDFEFAIRTVCEPIFDRPIRTISVGHLLLRLFQTAQRFHMKILPQLLLLQKTLVNVEGVGRQLYPDLDLWAAARPSLERWLHERVSWRKFMSALREHAPSWMERLPELPGLAIEAMDRIKSGRWDEASQKELQQLRQDLVHAQRQTRWVILGAALLLGVATLLSGGALLPGRTLLLLALAVAGMVLVIAALRGD
ncbi:MAG TPA: ubiquinone biosynthesis regulatory protein kinase UbiB [Gammaproteobacteria bacterium]|nr:ubiquinone biosynthesis regulatory protein kinase UbiB [Gammaproteobacteria bacterium]